MPEAAGIAGHLVEGGHELTQRVYFEDTDFSGRVYHARYLHFMERGRSDFLRLIGIGHRDLAAGGAAFAVRRMEIDFLAPAGIDDLLTIRTETQDIGGARLVLRQAIRRSGAPIVNATATLALVGPTGRAMRLPEAVRLGFQRRGPADAADLRGSAFRARKGLGDHG
jgi:acyl-CoA thioester hydrolase